MKPPTHTQSDKPIKRNTIGQYAGMTDMLPRGSNSQNYVEWKNADSKDKMFNSFICGTFLKSSRHINRGDHWLPAAENGEGGWLQMNMRKLSGVPTELKLNGNGIYNLAEFSQYHWLNPDNQWILKSIKLTSSREGLSQRPQKTETFKSNCRVSAQSLPLSLKDTMIL